MNNYRYIQYSPDGKYSGWNTLESSGTLHSDQLVADVVDDIKRWDVGQPTPGRDVFVVIALDGSNWPQPLSRLIRLSEVPPEPVAPQITAIPLTN